jgi:hypothetical protein
MMQHDSPSAPGSLCVRAATHIMYDYVWLCWLSRILVLSVGCSLPCTGHSLTPTRSDLSSLPPRARPVSQCFLDVLVCVSSRLQARTP